MKIGHSVELGIDPEGQVVLNPFTHEQANYLRELASRRCRITIQVCCEANQSHLSDPTRPKDEKE